MSNYLNKCLHFYLKMASKKIKKTILTKDGYLLVKEHFKESEIKLIKSELTVKPSNVFLMGKRGNQDDMSFEVFKENDEYLSIPKFYGIKKLGEADQNDEFLGDKMKIEFKGSLRPNQENIVNETLEHLLK